MKKVLLIGSVFLDKNNNGVTQKFISQTKAFSGLGADVDCICYDEKNKVILFHFEDSRFKKIKTLSASTNPYFRRFSLWISVGKYVKSQRYDLAYIRYPIIDFVVLRVLKHINESCSKVVMEIPSYPLEIENANLFRKVLYCVDRFTHGKCNKYIDRILYVGNLTDTIFGCPAKQIPNGLPELIRNIPYTGFHFPNNNIVLIGVSNMLPFHGYDRLLKGLADYYRVKHEYSVKVILVGDGSCRKTYESIVEKYALEDYVVFTGLLEGDQLSDVYQEASVGIGSLGMYREGFKEASSLKTKEYLIRGLPFVYAVKEIDLDEEFPFALRLPNDDSNIVIDEIVDFANSYKNLPSDIVFENMRSYAEDKYSWINILDNACGEYLQS